MKIRYLLRTIYPEGRLAARLRKLYPEGFEGSEFTARLPGDDTRWPKILDVLREHGMSRWQRRSEMNLVAEYDLVEFVAWEESDFARSSLVRLIPRMDGMSYQRNRDGKLMLGADEFPMFASVCGDPRGHIFIHERTRKRLLAEKFVGVGFKPAVLFGGAELYRDKKVLPWKNPAHRWWELVSPVEMPPLAPSVKLVNDRHEPLTKGDWSAGCHVYRDLDESPEKSLLRYRRRDVNRMKPFDLALTHELFGIGKLTDERQYIVSKPFYEYGVNEKWKVGWEPVIVE